MAGDPARPPRLHRPLRVRPIVVLAVVAAAALALAAAHLAGAVVIHAELAERLPLGARGEVVDAFALALLIGAAAALVPLLLFGGWLGGALERSLLRLRSGLVQRSRGEGAAPATWSRVAELDALAGAVAWSLDESATRELRVAAERDDLSRLVEAAGEGILQLGADGRLRRANRTARDLLALPPDAVGRPVVSLVRQADLRQALERAAREGSLDARELALDDRRVLVAAHPLPGPGGNGGATRRTGSVVVLVDLTELRRLEGVRRDFVANASHELKTPLTSIRGYAETLAQGGVPEATQRQFVETIRKNAERLQQIVDDLLDLSRLESGGWRPELEPVDVAEVAREVWAGFESRAAAAGFRIEAEAGLRVLADPMALRQVLSNLFDNALRHLPEHGAVSVRVAASPAAMTAGRAAAAETVALARTPPAGVIAAGESRVPARRALAVIEVRDTGSGIPGDALPRIFERFYRADPARSREAGGTGLGLSIVRHLTEQMGGTVEAESELGRGTLIRLRLPAA